MPGCGQPSASVSGEVTFDGEPIGKGHITFTPIAGQGGKDVGAPIVDGRYTVADLPPGRKLAHVFAVKKVSFASTSAEMARKAAEARQGGNYDGLVEPADMIPANADGNDVEVDIQPGPNVHNLHLKKPAKKN
ncbi:MAG TPA: hypothetical protein VGX76_11775 [Pirellulales bacterium]|nr:hypothetical protein [Pirellulales bacterium]